MKILLIRHGESEADLLKVHEGRADYPLTAEGIEQVKKLANRVCNEFALEKIWASTLQRASKTAAMLSEVIECKVEYLDELREHNNGDIAGKPLKEADDPFLLPPHIKWGTYGETRIEFRARAEQALSQILEQSKCYDQIAIVSHGGMISRLIESFLQLPIIHNKYFHTGDTGIHLLEINNLGYSIHYTNCTRHLREDASSKFSNGW
ncbi:histidine phosphatase family protein [Cytobacillus horneckiae]|uniref:histidine phosphatase family protein n=1 Tax=Cytobacillus horneckiae TaxID=549687 RepID=UPI00399F9B34